MKNTDELFQKYLDDAFSKTDMSQTMSDLGNLKKRISTNEESKKLKSKSHTFDDLVKKHTKNGKSSEKIQELIKNQLIKGIKVEMEHTNNKKVAKKIAMDHLYEDPNYYTKLKKMESKEATTTGSSGGYEPLFSGEEPKKVETKEATTSASVGAYETPAAWAKSTSKKDWRGKSKTQIPGGSFVKVKKKCKNFPYCNQGDIKALSIYENKIVRESIKRVAKELGLSENVIKSIIQYEMEISENISIYNK